MSASHIIELTADSFTFDSLVSVLTHAASSNQQLIQTATTQLSGWEKQPGYFNTLQTVFINTSLPLEIRYLSAIQIKNGIDRYWRKTATNAISKEEKAIIRSRCLEAGVNEHDHRLALQNAVLVAKIIRYEFPADWPDAISSILQYLRNAAHGNEGTLHVSRALLLVLYIVKELSTARLQRSRVALQNASPEILSVIGTIYVDNLTHFVRQAKEGHEAGILVQAETSLLALRILRRLLITGFDHPNRYPDVQAFWDTTRIHFGELLSLAAREEPLLPTRDQIEKHLIQISKLHLAMVQIHPAAFPQLPNSIEIAKAYWGLLVEFGKTFGTRSTSAPIGTDGYADDDVSYLETLGLKGLLILRACAKMLYNPLQTFKYQHTMDKQERKESKEAMKSQMLSESMIREMMETLVTRFFVFRAKDLRNWEEEPSEWERREEGEGEAWEFSVRLCAEKLFLDLVINNKDLLIQPLLQVFHAVATPTKKDVLLKDSVYGAIGLAAPVLHEQLDFDSFAASTLVPEVQIRQQGYNILRRRIAIMLGQWTLVKDINRTLVYQIFQFLLNKEDEYNDLVVRVTSGRQLKNVVDTWDIQIDHFLPYAAMIMGHLLPLIQEVDLSETKMALLNTVTVIVNRLEGNVTPYAHNIINLLEPLWQAAGDEYLIKQAILGSLSTLVSSMKGASRSVHPAIIPLVESAINPESAIRQYLLEDALDLWSSLVAQSTDADSDLLNLVQYLFPLYDTASELLRRALEITEQYALLAPNTMLQELARFTSVFKDLIPIKGKSDTNGLVLHLADILLLLAQNVGGSLAVIQAARIMDETNFLPQVFLGLKSSYDSHQTTGPNKIRTDIDGIVETDYWSVVARIVYADPAAFANILAASTEQTFVEAVSWVLTECFDHCESIGSTDKKKLMCLSMTKLLELGPQKETFGRLQEFMVLWSVTVDECMEYMEGDPEGRDCLIYGDPNTLKPETGTEVPEEERRRNLLFSDPVHKVNIMHHIRDELQQAIIACGGEAAFQEWLSNVDSDVVKRFGELAIM